MSNDFSIKQIETELARLQKAAPAEANRSAQKTEDGQGFGDVLKDAINEVNELQKTSEGGIEKQMLASESAELHTTMVQLQKAEVSFQTMMQVRNKILKAYEEIVRMPM